MNFRKCVLLKKNPKLIDTEKRSVVGRVGGWELREIGKGDFKKIEDYQSYLFTSHIEQSMFLYFACCSITKLYPTLGDPMDCSTPSFPVHHQFPELAQTHVHWDSDAVQPSLLSLSPHAFDLSQHEDLLQWGSLYQMSSIGASASVLSMIFRVAFLLCWPVWSPCSPGDSQESSPALQFESISSLVLSLLYGPTLTSVHDYWKSRSFDYMELCRQSNVSAF